MTKIRCSIVGASGYTGGELLRLLFGHPKVEVQQVTSENSSGKNIFSVHPNLRLPLLSSQDKTRSKMADLRFININDLEPCDVLFVALPHGQSSKQFNRFRKLAKVVIDLGQDFRLDPLFVYALAELHREELKTANYIAGAGCNATAVILGLYPFYKNNLIITSKTVVEAKISSSAAGNKPSLSSHHPERSGAVRSYKPTGHRHIAEICHELGVENIHFSATSIEMVRGILITAHIFLKNSLTDKDIWKLYRKEYAREPFIRIIKQKTGIYRYPEPKLVKGTNYCDIGFEVDSDTNRVVVMAAIDNLVKGSAGQVIQAFNIRHGFDEKLGLEFFGLHPC